MNREEFIEYILDKLGEIIADEAHKNAIKFDMMIPVEIFWTWSCLRHCYRRGGC